MSNLSESSPIKPFIQLATVLQGAQPLREKGINDSFRAPLMLPDGTTTPAIVKDVYPKELANELMVSASANAVGLPVPSAHLAMVPSGNLTVSKGPTLPNGAKLVFGSSDARTPPVAQLYSGQGTAAIDRVRKRLADWSGTGSLYGFDAWVANTDRHERNLVVRGDKEVWLIDHGHCFTGPNWTVADFDPARDYINKLNAWLTPVMSDARRTAVAAEAANLSGATKSLDLREIGKLNHILALLEGGEFDALISFLTQRSGHVPRLAATALDLVA